MTLTDEVRATCAGIVEDARSVAIVPAALDRVFPDGPPAAQPPPPDPVAHYLDGTPDEVAAFVLTLDSINFGSGWFPTLRKGTRDGLPLSGYLTIATAVSDRFRALGPWSNEELRTMTTTGIAATLGQDAGSELMSLYAQALRELGRFLGERRPLEVVAEAGGSAERLATVLAGSMALFADAGFYKRAQIVPSDLAAAGVAAFDDLDRLTIFADNLVPHVLRCDGVLAYEPKLARLIDEGRLLPAGRCEREIRAAAVHVCELLSQCLGVAPRTIDAILWNRGQEPRYKAIPRHRTRCVYY